ncbi:MAG: adenylate kinase [Oscillospiraceae bacterium]
MKKVIVIGCPGAGKSTFARRLRDVTGLPLYYLDMIWHNPDGTTIPKEEFDDQLRELITGDSWIIDGNYQRTLEERLECCDTVFLLDLPLEICIAGAQSRIGTKREDLPWTETEFDPEFRQWIEDFPEKKLPEICRLLEKYRDSRDIIIFHTRQEIECWFREQN